MTSLTVESTSVKHELETSLPYYTGTENYYKCNGFFLTDGVKYLCDTAGAYWLIDIWFSSNLALGQACITEDFQVLELDVNLEKLSGTVKITDGNETTLHTQNIEFTDFPLEKIKLFLSDNVIMLPSEY